MKLDKEVMNSIIQEANEMVKVSIEGYPVHAVGKFCMYLEDLDLVFKPGDSSQSVLVDKDAK